MDAASLRIDLIERVCRLPAELLPQADTAMRSLEQSAAARQPIGTETSSATKDWPHAPLHRLTENGTYMVTTGTVGREHLFRDPDRLTLLESKLLSLARQFEWQLEAWAVFSNHYHFVAHTLNSPSRLREFLIALHADTARELNRLDETSGRQVWHNFWDRQLTFEKSNCSLQLANLLRNFVIHLQFAICNAQFAIAASLWISACLGISRTPPFSLH